MINWADLLNPWMLAFLLGGVFLVFKKVNIDSGLPRPLELSIAAVFFLIYTFHFSIVVIVPLVESQSLAGLPCSAPTMELQCYSISAENCSTAWSHFEQECKEDLRKKLDPKNLSALIGPSVKKCVYKKLDRSFRSTRRTASEGGPCQEFFSRLDALGAD